MQDRHYSDNELLDRLYGVSARTDNHLDDCPECRARWTALSQARSTYVARQLPALPQSLLDSQQANVSREIERRASRPWIPGPMPALALAVFCAIVILLNRPVPQPVEISDAQFFAEAYSEANSSEPQAAAPIENLFQGEQSQ